MKPIKIIKTKYFLFFFILLTNTLYGQKYQFSNWPYPFGYPCCSAPNDSLLDDYDKNKDIVLNFDAGEHSVCKIKILDKHLKFYRLKPYRIYEIEVLDVYWTVQKFNPSEIKKYKFAFLRKNYSRNTNLTGTFYVSKKYLSLHNRLKLDGNIKYYISQPIIITSSEESYSDKIIKNIENKKNGLPQIPVKETNRRKMIKEITKSNKKMQYAHNFEVIKEKNTNKYSIMFIDTVAGVRKYVDFFDKQDISTTGNIKIHRKIDTLELLSELLSFEGDNRKSNLKIKNYGTTKSEKKYVGTEHEVSMQVYSLFIIQQLIFPNSTEIFPVLESTNNKANIFEIITAIFDKKCKIDEYEIDCESSTNGKIVKNAYKSYKVWFYLVKKNGVEEMKQHNSFPLNFKHSKKINLCWSRGR